MLNFHYKQNFNLESGEQLSEINIVYHTFGKLNEAKDNVIWVCHALTANSDPTEWWPNMIGENAVFDTKKYFIVCANILGSCYGSTGPLSIDPITTRPYYKQFPLITIRDMVKTHQLLCDHLGIKKIKILAGGSMGGYQVLEWCSQQPDLIEQMVLVSTSARESAWGIAIHTSQRLAIEADCSWGEPSDHAGKKGLKAARAFGLITYRNYATYIAAQTDVDKNKIDNFKASSYINYQGEKIISRFNAYSYWYLTKAMDSHNLARGKNEMLETVLQNLPQRTLLIGILSDILCPIEEQNFLLKHIKIADLVEIDSSYGHDGFLVETKQISKHIQNWMNKK